MYYIKLQSEYEDLDEYKNNYEDIIYYKKDTNIRHNPYGPAIIHEDGTKIYLIENKYHRSDGPALIFNNYDEQYWINDECFTKQQFEYHSERLKYLGKEHLKCLI